MLDERLAIVVDFGDAQEMDVGFDAGESFDVDMGYIPIQARYTGPYSVIPSMEEQTLDIAGRTASENIIVEAIPNCYGLITWDGTVLTVS